MTAPRSDRDGSTQARAPRRTRGRRSAAEARETRATLLRAACELFAERGYLQTSIRDIGRRAAVTSGAIYGHFRSKAELLAEVIHSKTADELEADTLGSSQPTDHVETLTEKARTAPSRRELRALILQGAAAAQTDDETRARLREEQLAHITLWVEAYERNRERLGIHPSVDIEAAVLYTWAVELGLGVLEGVGIEPPSIAAWADIQNRLARALRLEPEAVPGAAPETRLDGA